MNSVIGVLMILGTLAEPQYVESTGQNSFPNLEVFGQSRVTVTLHCSVTDASSGRPINAYRIGVKKGARKGSDLWQTQEVVSNSRGIVSKSLYGPPKLLEVRDESGTCEIKDVPTGTATIFILADSYAISPLTIEVDPSAGVQKAALSLERCKGQHGCVRDESGCPVSGALIYPGPISYRTNPAEEATACAGTAAFQTLEDLPGAMLSTDESGHFLLPSLPEDVTFISAIKAGYAPSFSRFPFGEDGVIRLTEGQTVAIVSHVSDADLSIVKLAQDGNPWFAECGTVGEGEFRFSDIPAGEAQITARFSRDNSASYAVKETVTVSKGNNGFVLQYPDDIGSVTGKVTVNGKKAVLGSVRLVAVSENDGKELTAQFHAGIDDGTFVFPRLPAANYVLCVSAQDSSGTPSSREDVTFSLPNSTGTDLTFDIDLNE